MGHQEVDVLFVENIGSCQRVGLLVSEFDQHSALDGLGWFGAAAADASNSVVPDANGLLVTFEE